MDIIKENIIAMWSCLGLSNFVNTIQAYNFYIIESIHIQDALFNYAIEVSQDRSLSYNIEEYYKGSGKKYFYWVDHQTPLLRELAKNFYIPVVGLTGMSMPLHLLPRMPSLPCTIKRVENLSQVRSFIKLIQIGFGLSLSDAFAFECIIKFSLNYSNQFIHYLLYMDGIPISTLTLFQSSNIVGIYNGTTHSNYQKQGLMSALIVKGLEHIRESGIEMAVAQAGPRSKSLLEKIGFTKNRYYKLFSSSNNIYQKDWVNYTK